MEKIIQRPRFIGKKPVSASFRSVRLGFKYNSFSDILNSYIFPIDHTKFVIKKRTFQSDCERYYSNTDFGSAKPLKLAPPPLPKKHSNVGGDLSNATAAIINENFP